MVHVGDFYSFRKFAEKKLLLPISSPSILDAYVSVMFSRVFKSFLDEILWDA